MTDFECVNYSAWVFLIYDVVMFWIHLLQFFHQFFQTFFFQSFLHPLADIISYSRNIINSLANGINIHHATAREKCSIVTFE